MKTIACALACLLMFAAAGFAAEPVMQDVESSLIAKIGYVAQTKTLSVQMNNSSDLYVYERVPQSVFDDFLAADSKGAFFVEKIKGKYSHEKEE
jgi:hypothetical protein